MTHLCSWFVGLLLLSGAWGLPAECLWAADPETVTDQDTDEIATQTQIFREESSRPPLREPGKVEIVQEEKPEKAEASEGPSFLVKKITLTGNTVFTEKDFAPLFAQVENRTLSLAELKSLAKAVTDYYRSQGYITSRAYLAPQKIKDGQVQISVAEGKIGKVVVEGNKYFSKKFYERAVRIDSDKVFRYQDLEKSLAELNQRPDHMAKAFITTGKDPGTSDIILKAQETAPAHLAYEFNNRGTKLTHWARHNTQLRHDNLFGFGDIFSSNISLAEEGALSAVALAYSFPWARTGTDFNLNYSYTRSELRGNLSTSKVEGSSFSLVPGITQKIFKGRRVQTSGYLNFEIVDSKTTVLHDLYHFDRMRVLVSGLRNFILDRWGKTFLDAALHTGIPDILNGSSRKDPSTSGSGSGGAFLFYTAELTRLQRLPYSSLMILKLGTQLTNDSLTSTEQYRAGGMYSVRGYPEGNALGDYGFDFSSEINTPVPFLPEGPKVPGTRIRWKEAIQLAGFIDGAKTYLDHRAEPSALQDRLLLGAGFGFRVMLREFLQVRMDYAFPWGDPSSENRNHLIHLSVRVGF